MGDIEGNPPMEPARRAHRAGRILEGTFEPFREVEIVKAIRGLATNKSPGPDAIPAEVYRNLPSMVSAITALITKMVETGRIPKILLEVHLAPLDKPRKDPQLCTSKRSTSLICTMVKIADAGVHNRMIHEVETTFHPPQYAHR